LGYNYPEEYHNDGFIGNGNRYMFYVVRVMIFYLGLDILPLCSLRVVDESRVIPKALLTSYGIVFVLSLLAIFGVACHYPGVHPSLGQTLFVIQYGLADATDMNPKYYPLLLLPPTLASATGYLFAAGNQLAAMSESGLMPSILQPRFGKDQVPVVSMVACGSAQFLVYYMIRVFEPKIFILSAQIWSISAPWLFVLICVSFIAFRVKFSAIQRNFVSPLGIPGAAFGVLCWTFMAMATSYHGFQPNTKAIKAFYIFMSIMVVYYFAYVRHVQFFSKEEQEKFMKVYTLNANRMRRRKSLGGRSFAALLRRVSDGPFRRFTYRGSYSSTVSSSVKERSSVMDSSVPPGTSSVEMKLPTGETLTAPDHAMEVGGRLPWSGSQVASVFVDGFYDLANVNSTDRDPDVLDEDP
jgi:amino acid permease